MAKVENKIIFANFFETGFKFFVALSEAFSFTYAASLAPSRVVRDCGVLKL